MLERTVGWPVGCMVTYHSEPGTEIPPPPFLPGPASNIRGWHPLVLECLEGVIRHKVPRDTDTPDDT